MSAQEEEAAVELIEYMGERLTHLATLVGDPDFHSALLAERQSVALRAATLLPVHAGDEPLSEGVYTRAQCDHCSRWSSIHIGQHLSDWIETARRLALEVNRSVVGDPIPDDMRKIARHLVGPTRPQ